MISLVPIAFKASITSFSVIEVCAGQFTTCGKTQSRSISSWSLQQTQKLILMRFGLPFLILFSPALFNNGRISCWGKSDFGALGRDNAVNVGTLGTMTILDFIAYSDTLPAIQVTKNNFSFFFFLL
jgi:hypothetical protein